MTLLQDDILQLIKLERLRQDKKWGTIPTRDMTNDKWIRVIVEEIGEAAAEIAEEDIDNLVEELVQVAAVAVAHIEHIVHRSKEGV